MRSSQKILLCWCTSIFLFLAACQSTPESEIVVNKGDGVYEQKLEMAKENEQQSLIPKTEKVEAPSAPAPTAVPVYEFEPHWTDIVSLHNFDVTIDVDVEAPTLMNFPVYRIKGSCFELNDTRLEKIFQVLIGEVEASRPGGMTVQDYKERLERLQKGQYDYESKEWIPYDKEAYDEQAEEYVSEMQVAPDEDSFIYADKVSFDKMNTPKVFKGKNGVLWEVLYTEDSATISRFLRGSIQPESWIQSGDAIAGEAEGTTLKNVSCTEDEARRYTAEFFEAINIGEMAISFMEKGRVVDRDNYQTLKEGWIVECARRGGACPAFNYKQYAAYTGGNLRFTDRTYSAGLTAESIELFVDNQGVASLTWRNPVQILETEVGNIEILPYEQMQELLKQAMVNGLSWTGNKKNGSAFSGCYVTRVILSYCFVPVKDSPEEFYFTPTWFVLMHYNEDTVSMLPFIIAINAVDGTRIDLSSVS